MITGAIGLVLGLVVGAGCRFFDIPSPAPPRFIGACLLLAMTLGFVVADHILPTGGTLHDSIERPAAFPMVRTLGCHQPCSVAAGRFHRSGNSAQVSCTSPNFSCSRSQIV